MERIKRYNLITNNIFFDNFLVYLPFWFPILYILISFNNPPLAPYLFLVVLFLFAETHFASTWLFFFDQNNRKWVKKNSYKIIFLPLYIILMIAGVWYFNPALVVIAHYVASGFHVTRQSIGIAKLTKISSNLNLKIIYFFSSIFLAVGLFRPGIITSNLSSTQGNLILLIITFLYLILILVVTKNKNYNFDKFYAILTGVFIYAPLLFFKDRATATAIGVGMHWSQYIVLMWCINFRKLKIINESKRIKKPLLIRIIFVFSYAFIMTSLTYFGMPQIKNNEVNYSIFYLFPLLFQIYHFYLDGFIWRFSDPFIKKNIAKFIFSEKVN